MGSEKLSWKELPSELMEGEPVMVGLVRSLASEEELVTSWLKGLMELPLESWSPPAAL